jgi:toluene monooxygenase system ferredoxin subunit
VLIKLIHKDELWVGEKRGFNIAGIDVVLLHTELGFSAFQNRCPHAGASMSEGILEGCTFTCARHLWQFDACTGKGLNPVSAQLHPYSLIIDKGGVIWVELGGES